MANAGIVSGKSQGLPKRRGRTEETPLLLHAGPVVTSRAAKATFIAEAKHLAFDETLTHTANKVRRMEAELPVMLPGSLRWVPLVSLDEGGHQGSHKVRQILSRY